MPVFSFRHAETNELRSGEAATMREACKTLTGIELPPSFPWTHMGWRPWECWDGDKCLWHYTEEGEIVDGPRPPEGQERTLNQDIAELERLLARLAREDELHAYCYPTTFKAQQERQPSPELAALRSVLKRLEALSLRVG